MNLLIYEEIYCLEIFTHLTFGGLNPWTLESEGTLFSSREFLRSFVENFSKIRIIFKNIIFRQCSKIVASVIPILQFILAFFYIYWLLLLLYYTVFNSVIIGEGIQNKTKKF